MRLITKLTGLAMLAVPALAGCSYEDHDDHYRYGPRRAYLYDDAHYAGYHDRHHHRHHEHRDHWRHDDHRHHYDRHNGHRHHGGSYRHHRR